MTAAHASASPNGSWLANDQPPRGSADEAIQPSVAQALPPRLAGRAVRDLVRFVGDAAQIVAAVRAGFAVLAVDGEVIADLRGQAAGSFTFDLEGVIEHAVDRFDQALTFIDVELAERGVRRELRAVQDVVGVAPTDPGD